MDFQFVPRDTVKVPEIQYVEQVSLPIQKTPVIIVDMQNDFVKPQRKEH